MRRTGVRTFSTGCFCSSLQNSSPQKVLREVCSSRKRSRPRGSSVSEIGVARDHAVGMADRAMELQVERAEGRDRHRGRPAHHHGQRLAHIDRRIDVDPAGGHQRGHQLELVGDRIEPALDQLDLRLDHAAGAVDQQALGRAGGAGQHDDVGDAGDQRQRRERQRQRSDQRQPEGTARGARPSSRQEACVKPETSYGVPARHGKARMTGTLSGRRADRRLVDLAVDVALELLEVLLEALGDVARGRLVGLLVVPGSSSG